MQNMLRAKQFLPIVGLRKEDKAKSINK